MADRRKQGGNKHLISQVPSNVPKLPFADICHKKSNGTNNWAKFKETEKVGFLPSSKFKPTNTENSYKKSKVTGTNNWNTFKELQITSKPQVKTMNDGKGPTFYGQKKSGTGTGNSFHNKPHFVKHGRNSLNPKLTKCIAIDCEMVGVDEDAKTNMLARVSIVNSYGECLYDKFVKPIEPVIDYRTIVSGVRPKDLENGEDFSKVQREVAEILKRRTLVGHALKNDMSVLFLTHPRGAIRDTSKYKKFHEEFKTTPSLKKLTAKYLGVTIQEGEHSSIEDAKAAMMLYMMFRKEWEAEYRRKRSRKTQATDSSKAHNLFTCDDV